MDSIDLEILGVFVGKGRFLENSKVKSAIFKERVLGKLDIRLDSLPGDQAVDLKHHGGLDRVIHHYSNEQYAHLKRVFPESASLFVPGSYGENITTEILTEKKLCVGDVFRLGTALVQVTEPRKPCSMIDTRYGFKGVLKEIVKSRRYGWFYRVLEEGSVEAGDRITLLERPFEKLNLDRLIEEIFQKKEKNIELIREYRDCKALSERFKVYLEKYN